MIHSFVSSIRHCNVCSISCFRLKGFGRTKKDGNGGYYSPNILQEVELKYVTNDDCNATWSPLDQSIEPSMMCAYDPGKGPCDDDDCAGNGPCGGDDGSPLFDATENVLVGIVSYYYCGGSVPSEP